MANHVKRSVAWWACLPMLPIVVFQAKGLRRKIPRLPEAAGFRAGTLESGPGRIRIAVVGESTAVGVGVTSLDEAIPGNLAHFLCDAYGHSVDWHVLGANGATVRRVVAQLKQGPVGQYDAAVVLLGVNDVFRMTSVGKWLSGLDELCSALRDRGCRTVVFSSIPPISRFSALPQPLRRILGVRAALLDGYLEKTLAMRADARHCAVKFPTGDGFFARDGVHPSAAGYREWARQLADELGSSLDDRARQRS